VFVRDAPYLSHFLRSIPLDIRIVHNKVAILVANMRQALGRVGLVWSSPLHDDGWIGLVGQGCFLFAGSAATPLIV
jgi:hypothetical protein